MSPQLQWLGDIEQGSQSSDLAKALGTAIGSGVSAYAGTKMKQKERELEKQKLSIAQSEVDVKKSQAERDYAKVDYDKRKDAYDSMIKLLPSVPADKQKELTGSPEWIALESSLGLPHLGATTFSDTEKKPSWGQEQEVAAVRSAISQGRGTLSQMVGEPLSKDIKTKQDALDYISLKGLDPSLFANELAQYDAGEVSAVKGKVADKYKVGQTVNKGGVTYTYKGNGRWSY